MRAVRVSALGSPPGGDLVETADPVPGDDEVLVEIHAAPVNYVDAVTITGNYQFTPALPYIPGKGPAGVVRAVGSNVSGVDVGDRVLAMAEYGGYAELVAVDHRQVYRLPDALSFVDAAAMSLAMDTAWMALRERARIKAGDSVLVLGATGAVGGAAVQLAKAMGARLVLAGVSCRKHSSDSNDTGADGIVDLSANNPREAVRRQVFAVTDGTGVDIVIDPLGGDFFDGAIRSLAWRGRMVVVGFAAGRIPSVKVNYLLLKNIEISGIQISDYRRRRPDLMAECYRELFELYEAGRIRAPLGTTRPLTEWKDALDMVRTRNANSRIVLLPRYPDFR